MYRFSFVKSIAGKATEVDKELFHKIITDKRVKDICERIAACSSPEERGALKRQLPAFCWHAWFDDGKRKNYAAHASGLIMIDLDHVGDARAEYNKVAESALANGLLAAHVTPSTEGLRLVFPVPQGMDIVKAQSHYVKTLKLKNVDACTKDLARLSFCVPEDYWLYIDEEKMFEGTPIPEPSDVGDSFKSGLSPDLKNQPSDVGDSLSDGGMKVAGGVYDETYDGVPYTLLVESLQTLLGGTPAHGSRNNFIFSMAAYLRYVCNDDADWIASILPTYG